MERFIISLTPEMKAWLVAQAEAKGLSMASVVRLLIHDAMPKQKEIDDGQA